MDTARTWRSKANTEFPGVFNISTRDGYEAQQTDQPEASRLIALPAFREMALMESWKLLPCYGDVDSPFVEGMDENVRRGGSHGILLGVISKKNFLYVLQPPRGSDSVLPVCLA
jgi:hypothetical protein